jgi:hypothetical protein
MWPRSEKAWELTVERMRGYMSEDEVFTHEQAGRLVAFLTRFMGEGVLLREDGSEPDTVNPDEWETPGLAAPIVQEPEAVPEIKPAGMPEPRTVLKRFWNPSRGALSLARCSGFLSVASLLTLLASGFLRRRLKRRFRRIHVTAALVLFVSLSLHGIIYIFEYGTPNVLWYGFGLAAFVALIVTQVQGIVRKRFGRGLLTAHIAGACLGLVLSILHWIWAWM